MSVLSNRSTWPIAILSAILACCPLQAQPAQANERACRETVGSFYHWYAPLALRQRATPAWAIAQKERSKAFTSELARLLKEDSEAQTKAVGDIVGLDFDPFLYTQDPSGGYTVGKTTIKGESCFVQLAWPRQGSEKRDVIAELVYRHDQWVFTNFHYGKSAYSQDENLVSILKRLQSDRRGH